ncbi:MAG TPA: hypothetical protein VFU29_15570 [Chitinophagaceae bacterium]|nr:hypothetical protein [Chitinophagaceae bacterium]
MKKTILIILLAMAGNYGKLIAQTPAVMLSDKTGWHKIGERHVDFVKDRDEILVIGANRFSAIKFMVTEASIDLRELEVYYESGDKQVIKVHNPVKAGSESQVFNLKGHERELKKIVFVYKTLPNQKDEKAHVEIWGLKTNANTTTSANANSGSSTVPSVAVIVSDKTGWHKIGERQVDFVKDRDEILVAGADRFSSIKFMVTEASIDLLTLEVYYESGDRQDIEVHSPIMAGNESRIIDLNGGERSLKKIVFVYKTLPNQKDEKAEVEVWGLKTNIN